MAPLERARRGLGDVEELEPVEFRQFVELRRHEDLEGPRVAEGPEAARRQEAVRGMTARSSSGVLTFLWKDSRSIPLASFMELGGLWARQCRATPWW